ncbi:unnamed protein product [Caenorhabditis sp. 36 PRJEB53466]|nr:unnamed protein product [Caenorhabditis sp. 36 PRJEB53466]
MIRFDPDECSEMSEEKRFYYLRLMAKPGGKPIKTKFVTWSRDEDVASASNISDQQLESQAMRVVRTIGQAFEVCHKVAQDQMQEKHEDDAAKSKLSVQSEDEAGPNALDVIEERGGREENSRSSSPMEAPPVGGPLYGKRLSLFQPRKPSTASSSGGTAIDTTAIPENLLEIPNTSHPILQPKAPEIVPQLQPQTALPYNQKPAQSLLNIQPPQQFNTLPSQMPSTQTLPTMPENPAQSHNPRMMTVPPNLQYPSATLPHSRTWGPQIPSYPQSLQSLEQNVPMYYPRLQQIPGMLPSSSSLPFGLSSPVMVSPYATLQLNMQSQQLEQPDHSGSQITMDQYNQQLMRSQLDQAQQSVQVAGCQVQLLRDQLTSETTARLEAQSRTHQLLSANRDLLEQVQNLVSRLQMLETKITSEIHHSAGQPQPTYQPSTSTLSMPRMPLPIDHTDPRIPAGSSTRPNYPYQVQPLADLRAGSLPPVKESKDRRREEGARTEPESNAEDTTDYSSSDQYEKTSNVMKSSHFNILMSNPLVDINVPSGAVGVSRMDQIEHDDTQGPSSTPPKKERKSATGILRGEKDFSRMSFNAKLAREKEKEQQQLMFEDQLEEEPARSIPPSPPRKEKNTTIDSLFKTQDDPPTLADREILQQPPQPLPPVNRKNTTVNLLMPTVPSMPASSSVVTAMYPPIRQPVPVNKPKVDVFRKKTLRTLSMDIAEEPETSGFDSNRNNPSGSASGPFRRKPANIPNVDIEIKEIEDYINRNVDRSKLPETSLLTRLTRQAQGDNSLGNLPNGYPQ